jgi:ribosomal protein S18 acetylase RimI-like enzyme
MIKVLLNDFMIDEATDLDTLELVDLQEKMALETENVTLNPDIVEQGIATVLQDSSKGKYYKIVQKGKIVGCTLTTYEWSEWRNGNVVWIQSLYILPAYRRQGLFTAVYQYLREIVQKTPDYKGIRLYVDKRNKSAIEAYKSVDMNNEHYEMFEWLK